MNLLLLEPGERELAARDPRARHIRKVLRSSPGDSLRAGEVGGSLGTATIESASSGGIVLEFTPTFDPRPLAPVELLLGHPRPIVLRRLLRDLAALGPASIVVTHTDLGERSYYESNLWDDVRTPLLEGAAQGGSTLLPALTRASSLEDAVARLAPPHDRRILLHEERETAVALSGGDSGGAAESEGTGELEGAAELAGTGEPEPPDGMRVPGLLQLLGGLHEPGRGTATARQGLDEGSPARLAVAIGSERGWTAREVRVLEKAGFQRCTLGHRILRTETASTIAVWAAIAWCEGRV